MFWVIMRIVGVAGFGYMSSEEDPFVVPSFDEVPGLPPVFASKTVQLHVSVLATLDLVLSNYETPIAIRFTDLFDVMFWNCQASYHEVWLDAVTLERPATAVPYASLHSSDARALCCVYAAAAAFEELFEESDAQTFTEGFAAQLLGITEVGLPEELASCNVTSECAADYAEAGGYEPRAVGAAVAYGVLRGWADDDGWNADGSRGQNGRDCTANCRPYQDYSGYDPTTNSSCAARASCWEPLQEDNGRGFFVRQEHVVPHVGPYARPRVLTRAEVDARGLPAPDYDYDLEATLVIDRLRELDDETKAAIEFFDDKTAVAILWVVAVATKYGASLSLERLVWLLVGYTAGELDATIVVWNEKVRHSLVRTTTVIQQRSGLVETWAGPHRGLGEIDRRDFQPYIRVMPHAEFPSGSGCLCLAVEDFSDAALLYLYNDTTALPVVVPVAAGSSSVEPGTTPAEDLLLVYPSVKDYRLACGSTRLAGGMHFTAAVNASYDLCDGIGTAALSFATALLENSPLA